MAHNVFLDLFSHVDKHVGINKPVPVSDIRIIRD